MVWGARQHLARENIYRTFNDLSRVIACPNPKGSAPALARVSRALAAHRIIFPSRNSFSRNQIPSQSELFHRGIQFLSCPLHVLWCASVKCVQTALHLKNRTQKSKWTGQKIKPNQGVSHL